MAESWGGYELDDRDGARVGVVHGVYLDAESGEPVWLIAGLGRRRQKPVAIPLTDCAAAPGRVWTAYPREVLGEAPTVDPTRPLLREHELTICAHYGIGERVGRAAAVSRRAGGARTAEPAGSH